MNPGIEDIRKRGSRILTEGVHMLPAASLMLAEGVIQSFDDLKKPFVTVINSYTNQIPGHAHLDRIGAVVRDELKALGFNVWYVNVGAAVCDGIAMGHFGMKYSLASRELISDQIETIIGAHPCDSWIGIANCDKIVPAMVNAMVRINNPAVYVSGGPMLAGPDGSDLITVFEGVGKHSVGKMSETELRALAGRACPGCGSCAGMFTTNSMNCLGEAIGLALPGNGTTPAERWTDEAKTRTELNPDRIALVKQAAHALKRCLQHNVRPLDIVNEQALVNAFVLDMAMGGSTNTILHALALAQLRGVLAFELNRPILQDDRREPSSHEPFRNIVTFRVNRQIYEAAAGGDDNRCARRGRRSRLVDGQRRRGHVHDGPVIAGAKDSFLLLPLLGPGRDAGPEIDDFRRGRLLRRARSGFLRTCRSQKDGWKQPERY